MIDPLQERLLSLREVAATVPGGVNVKAVVRWRDVGLKDRAGVRHKLPCFYMGRRPVTTASALRAFLKAVNQETGTSEVAAPATDKDRDQQAVNKLLNV